MGEIMRNPGSLLKPPFGIHRSFNSLEETLYFQAHAAKISEQELREVCSDMQKFRDLIIGKLENLRATIIDEFDDQINKLKLGGD